MRFKVGFFFMLFFYDCSFYRPLTISLVSDIVSLYEAPRNIGVLIGAIKENVLLLLFCFI